MNVMGKIKVAVLGASGLVGREFLRMLAGHPWCEVLAASAAECREKGVRVVFSTLPADTAAVIEAKLRDEGVFVFSNASAHRMDADVPIVIPEVNPEHMDLVRGQRSEKGGFIVTNSNCTTSGLALALAPLVPFGIRTVTVSTYQSISGAGRKGLAAMEILGNAIPYIAGEEEKIEQEVGKILGSSAIDVRASACRVPVREGHLESVLVEFERDVTEEQAARAFSGFCGVPQELGLPSAPLAPIIVLSEPDRPQPALDLWAGEPARAAGMAVSVGRIRRKGKALAFHLLVHNLVRGAAGTCVLAFELALKKGYLE
jgi:aspartate-semialdehyde dehydrogenase